MATTSDMNTPEHATKDNNNKNNNNKEYIDKLQAQFVQNQIRQIIHGRDYGRILRESNKPAQWYKASPITRSVYYYDPNYQKYLQQQSKLLTNTRFISSPIRVTNQSKPRTKYTSMSYNNLGNHHQQKQKLSSRLQSVTTLPPILMHKKPHDE